jgi:hypothetical protein
MKLNVEFNVVNCNAQLFFSKYNVVNCNAQLFFSKYNVVNCNAQLFFFQIQWCQVWNWNG